MNTITRFICTATFAFVLPTAGQAQEIKAEVLHWWTSGGEAAAIAEMANAFKAEGGEWIDTAIANGEQARTAGINRIVGGNPPTVMQFNTGAQFHEVVDNGMLNPIEDVASANNWREVLPEVLIEATNRNGEFYAVPVNIHGQNWLWYNVEAFKKAGVEPPKDFDELIAAAPKLKEAGFIPLAHGGQNWQDHLLFDAVVVAKAGKEIFKNIYLTTDGEALNSPDFRSAIETFAALRELTDEGSPGRSWNDSTNLVITGKGATQLMGDWAKGEFIAAGKTIGTDYGCTVMPNGYIMGGDVCVFPKVDDEEQKAAQSKLAELMLSQDVQLAFNKKKGSVPARVDLDVSSMDECAQQGMTALKDPEQQVGSINYFASSDLTGATRDVITQFWATPSMTADEFIEKFASAVKSAS
ncbi:MAG: ABC transporter substrate-binding protein [Hyphomicrobiales bacterium]|nr:ABC transporter substrate-binding protein [Hyphomicrobiales bacterium]